MQVLGPNGRPVESESLGAVFSTPTICILTNPLEDFDFLFFLFFFEFIYFYRERERESASTRKHEQGRGREREKDRVPSRLCSVSVEPDKGLESMNQTLRS